MRVRRVIQLLVILCCILTVTSKLNAKTTVPIPPNHHFLIADSPSSNESAPSIAYDPDRQQFLVAYINLVAQPPAINAVCINGMGEVISSYVLGSGWDPDAVYDPANNSYIIVWEEYVQASAVRTIMANSVSGTCCQQVGCAGAPFEVSGDRSGDELWAAVAYNQHAAHQDLLIVWWEDEDILNQNSIWGRRMDGTTLKGPSFPIVSKSTEDNIRPDVAYNLNMNEFIVVYAKDLTDGTTANSFDIYGIRLKNEANSTGGVISGSEHAIDTTINNQYDPAVAAYRLNQNTPYFVVFTDEFSDTKGDIRGYLLDKTGNPQTLVRIATETNAWEENPRIHSFEPRGGYAVVWTHMVTIPNRDVMWRKVSPQGQTGNAHIVFDSPNQETQPDIINCIDFPFAVWTDVDGSDAGVYGRFLYEKTFIPLVLRNP